MIEFCEWSKKAEWRDDAGVKRMFINNEWGNYIKTFLKERKSNAR